MNIISETFTTVSNAKYSNTTLLKKAKVLFALIFIGAFSKNIQAGISAVSATSADLFTVNSSVLPSSLMPGDSCAISCTVINIGDGNTENAFSVQYFLSSDKIYDTSDILLGSSQNVNTLDPAASVNILPRKLKVPPSLAPGIYYIILYSDHANTIQESDKQNNIDFFQITLTGFPDYLVQSPVVSTNKAFSGDSISISCKILNSGGNSQNNIVDVQYFLSQNNTLSSEDIALSNLLILNSPKKGELSTAATKNYLIPSNTLPGSYYIIFVIDGTLAEVEADEKNNNLSIPVTIETRPDFSVIASPSSSFIFAGDSLSITGNIQNTGSTSTLATSIVEYYFSTDNVHDQDDLPIGKIFETPILNGGASIILPKISFQVPRNKLSGTYYILILTDTKKSVKESNETNNITALKITVASPDLADLLFTNTFISPSALVVGDTLSISCTIKNEGASAAPESKVQYFLSTDNEYDDKDTPLNEYTVPTLPIGSEWNSPLNKMVVPSTLKGGKYYVLLLADKNRSFMEASETNNLSMLLIKISGRADLTINAPVASPLTIYEGDSINISGTAANLGEGTSEAYVSLQYFLSTDSIYDFTDVPISNVLPIAPLIGSLSRPVRAGNYRIPESTPAGNYFIILFIDNNKVFRESNEENNITHIPVKILAFPDLVVATAKSAPAFLLQGDPIAISTTIKNIGKGTTLADYHLFYFLSRDERFDKDDTPISSPITMTQLSSGGSAQHILNYTFADNLPPGIWYILVKVDHDGLVREANEMNNIYALEVMVGDPEQADLYTDYFFPDISKMVAGDSLNMKCTIKNKGAKDVVAPYLLQYYLSQDEIFDNADIAIGAPIQMNPLPINNKQELGFTKFRIPLDVKPGKYNLIAYPDIANSVNESIERNNILSSPLIITPFPDFKVRKYSASPFSLFIGDKTTVSIAITNGGGSASLKPISMQYFLSKDPVYDINDLPISRAITVNKLEMAQDTIMPLEKLTIPQTILGGLYYLIANIDSKSQVIEISEENNIATVPLEIKPRPVVNLPDDFKSENLYVNLDVTVSSEIPVASVVFTYRKITDSLKTVSQSLPLGDRYKAGIPKSYLDEIGVEYVFLATDSSGNQSLLSKGSVPKEWVEPGLTIPLKSFGKSTSNYRIVAIPAHLEYNRIDSVFKVLGPYDKKKWRVYNYRNKSNTEFLNGIQTIEPGLGYWLAVADSTDPIITGRVFSVTSTIENPFNVKLVQGWNQIGNPYNINLSFSDIQKFKMNKSSNLLKFYKYLGEWNSGDTLHKMEGAFVFSSDTTTLYFPTHKNNKIQTRQASAESNMTNSNWQLPIAVEGQGLRYKIAGLGMHENAQLSSDQYDEFTPPAFGDYIEINFNHPEYFYSKFTKDIITSCHEHVWEFEVNSNKTGNKILKWENQMLNGVLSGKLLLYDQEAETLVDMTKTNSYAFTSTHQKRFRVLYGNSSFIETILQPERITLSSAKPNPFSGTTEVSVTLPKSEFNYEVSLQVFSGLGQKVKTIATGNYSSGFHEFTWNGISDNGEQLPAGIYIFQLQVKGGNTSRTLSQKVVLY